MNKDIRNAKWRQFRGKTKVWWAKLNHNNRTRLAGKYDTLVGTLQEKYGHTRQQAARGTDKWLSTHRIRLRKTRFGSKS